ncbi:MAG: DUF4065 domain-containing protein [Lachnospiraceae bacterium]|nr:DUF4065 domain-containing protein [Lachnospiraceae bacterium]
MNMEVIHTEKRMCICCMEEHDVKTVRLQEHTIFKNVSVDYVAEYYYCDAAEELYMDEGFMSSNDVRMKDAYRKKMRLLTSTEISAIRTKYGVTQSDLCTLLGWGGKTITRYESHQVQDKAHDTILKKLDQDPEWFFHLLFEAKEMFAPGTYEKYKEKAIYLYEKNQDSYLRKSIEAKYVRFRDNELYNGKTLLSLDKVVDVIRYFASSPEVISLYKVKLMKMMWYADFLAYKLRGSSITGLVYQALPMGAVPIGHDSIIDLKGIPCEEINMGDGTAYRFFASNIKEYPTLLNAEKEILDIIIEKLGKMSTNEIVAFMHREEAYVKTLPRDIIQFQYAEKLQI